MASSSSSSSSNAAITLASRPVEMVSPDNFSVVEWEAAPAPTADAPLTVALSWISVDPYMRGRMRDTKSYVAPFEVGAPLEGGCVATVTAVADGTPGWAVGDTVVGRLSWIKEQTIGLDGLSKVDPTQLGVSPSLFLGALGLTGLTALLPIEKFTSVSPGDVAYVSGAAGAVGSVAGAIFKSLGATVIGSAGSDEKVEIVKDVFGFDAAFNYKSFPTAAEGLASVLEPGQGIDVYYDNVGGEMLEAVLNRMNTGGVIICCGAISQYNLKPENMYGIKNTFQVVAKSLTMSGFIVTNWADEFPAGIGRLAAMVAEGKIPARETVYEGFDRVPEALCALFEGANIGKLVCKL